MAAKEETAYYQWEIMRMLNIEDEEIKKYINSHGLHHLIFYYIICVCKTYNSILLEIFSLGLLTLTIG